MTTPEVRAEALAYMRRERPPEDDSMERYRAEYLVTWRYVTGGRASHAFFGDETVPACGLVALRGPEGERREPRWHDLSAGALGVRMWVAHHRMCMSAVARRRVAYDVRERLLKLSQPGS
jgi:hypothetical protein